MTKSQGIFIAFGILFFLFIGCAVYFNGNYNLNKIKSKTVGDGQYGTRAGGGKRGFPPEGGN